MGTDAGFRMFAETEVNRHFKAMFDVWTGYLRSPDSRSVLTPEDDGWFGTAASAAMPDFANTYICDPNAEYHGFPSWDDFFTREFRVGKRPVHFQDNDSIINSACESTVYRIARSIKAKDKFWLKGQPYSLDHMLNDDELAPQFAGGTVYQAFLSATKYHRWHSPVNGVVVKTVNIPGTYYAQSPTTGFGKPDGPDLAAPNKSQAFITATAARALIFIRADNPSVGLMCFMAVGMAEVSTCEVTVSKNQRVKKGDQLGMFHFGGSTYCLIFRPQTEITFVRKVEEDVLLNEKIATVAYW